MNYGITTVHAHLDSDVMDFFALNSWLDSMDFGKPAFAGRYFLGHATQAEADAGQGFCLWAHGEGASSDIPTMIVPIQRADPVRQSSVGQTGRDYGKQDAEALAAHINACLAVGDLEYVAGSKILVFLEVNDNTDLSIDYWTEWAKSIYDALLSPGVNPQPLPTDVPVQLPMAHPLVPGIFCAFEFDYTLNQFLPDLKVRACLSQEKKYSGDRNRCYGFWARRFADTADPPGYPFAWENLGAFRQKSEALTSGTSTEVVVPIYYLRIDKDLLDWLPADNPAGDSLSDTLRVITLEQAASDDNDPLPDALIVGNWAADITSTRLPPQPPLIQLPTQLGIDTATSLITKQKTIGCLREHNLKATRMPYDRYQRKIETPINLEKPCTFVFRYYANGSGKKVLTKDEAIALSAAGLGIGICWEANVNVGTATGRDKEIAYVNGLTKPFVDTLGREHAKAAFSYAAQTIGQPPYTPIFFAVDFPVDDSYYDVATPPLEFIITYFEDVQRGYRDYLSSYSSTPYFIGVYAQVEVCSALYQRGLATHFWQPPWSKWGNSWPPFRHLNAWQIAISHEADMDGDNSALRNCATINTDNGEKTWFDLNVAWGDPGTFQVFR